MDPLRRFVRQLARLARGSDTTEQAPAEQKAPSAPTSQMVDTFEPAVRTAHPPAPRGSLVSAFRADTFSGFVDGFEGAVRPPVNLSGGLEPITPEVFEVEKPAPVEVSTGFLASLDDLFADQPAADGAANGDAVSDAEVAAAAASALLSSLALTTPEEVALTPSSPSTSDEVSGLPAADQPSVAGLAEVAPSVTETSTPPNSEVSKLAAADQPSVAAPTEVAPAVPEIAATSIPPNSAGVSSVSDLAARSASSSTPAEVSELSAARVESDQLSGAAPAEASVPEIAANSIPPNSAGVSSVSDLAAMSASPSTSAEVSEPPAAHEPSVAALAEASVPEIAASPSTSADVSKLPAARTAESDQPSVAALAEASVPEIAASPSTSAEAARVDESDQPSVKPTEVTSSVAEFAASTPADMSLPEVEEDLIALAEALVGGPKPRA